MGVRISLSPEWWFLFKIMSQTFSRSYRFNTAITIPTPFFSECQTVWGGMEFLSGPLPEWFNFLLNTKIFWLLLKILLASVPAFPPSFCRPRPVTGMPIWIFQRHFNFPLGCFIVFKTELLLFPNFTKGHSIHICP